MQSDTWALASPFMRPWLLMTWMVAWQQTPCGSLPNSDELIAARIGMEIDQFATNRKILMRGWWLADDGRLYHDQIAQQAIHMLDKKRIERERKDAWRKAQAEKLALGNEVPAPSQAVTDMSHGTDAGLPRESTVSDDTGTGTGTGLLNTNVAQAAPDRSGCPHQEIIALFHQVLPEAPRVIRWTEARARALRARWREDPKRQDLDWWKRLFEFIRESDFLMGRVPPSNGHRQFVVSLPWLLASENFLKVIEGNYQPKELAA